MASWLNDCAPLVAADISQGGDDVLSRVLAESETAESEDKMEAFENAEDPKVEYDLELREVHALDSLLTLTSVTVFLAGFIAADFSGFSMEDWENVHWLASVSYMFLLAFSEGCCLYLSICGTIAGVTYQRAKNHCCARRWEMPLRSAFGPITKELRRLKGKRMKAYKAAATAFIKKKTDFANCYIYSGAASSIEDIQARVELVVVQDDQGAELTYVVNVQNPAGVLGEKLAFKYLHKRTAPVAILCYLGAQTLKALSDAPVSVMVAAVAPVSYWVFVMIADLVLMYKKILD